MFVTLTVAMVVLAVLCFGLFKYADNNYGVLGFISGLLALLSGTACFILAVYISIATYNWYAAEYQANIINREYNTQYTQEEIFYASDVINTIREIQRNRNEITLNVNTEKK